MIDRNEYTKWLAFEIDLYGKYHNHKETMAWVITALYIPSIIYLGYRVGAIWRCAGYEWAIIVLMVFAGNLVGIFQNMQFSKRWEAADGVRELRWLWAKFNNDAELPREDEWRFDKDTHLWPYLVQHKVEELQKDSKRNCRKAFDALWRMFLWFRWRKGKDDDRWKTELPSYFLVLIATVIAIYLALN